MKKIMIVEDDSSTAELLRDFLTKSGYEVRVEKNGKDVARIAKTYGPGLILLDAVLPGMDGQSIQEELSKDPKTKKIPIVLMTAHSEVEQAFVDKKAVVGFFVKPFDLGELKKKVQTEILG